MRNLSFAVLAFFGSHQALSFQLHPLAERHRRLLVVRLAVEREESPENEFSSLQFVGETSFESDPVDAPADVDQLLDFFQDIDHRNCVLLGEGPAENGPAVQEIDPDPKLYERWAQESERMGTVPPSPGDSIVLVQSSALPFPLGVSIFVDSIVGCKLVVQPGNRLPEYQFTLIRDSVHAEGPRPLKWVFRKIMGNRNNETAEQTTHSTSRLRVVESDNDSSHHQLKFICESCIEINIHFPALLLRILPMSREQCNLQGSTAIQTSFDERGGASFSNFVEAYQEWNTVREVERVARKI